jgi:hypothetical protein
MLMGNKRENEPDCSARRMPGAQAREGEARQVGVSLLCRWDRGWTEKYVSGTQLFCRPTDCLFSKACHGIYLQLLTFGFSFTKMLFDVPASK